MNTKALLLGAVASIALAGTANAGHFKGYYVGIEGGANWVDDNQFDFGSPIVADFNNAAEYESGWAVLATLGYAFASDWRLEGEVGYRINDVDLFSSAAALSLFRSGELSEWSAMVNVHRDFHLGSRLMLSLGVGAGMDYANVDDGVIDDGDWNFAYQGIAGLSYAIGARTDLTLSYRYLRVEGPAVSGPHLAHVDNELFEDLTKHTVTIGLRYDLHPDEVMAPPPPPAPPMAPPPMTKNFVIYFGAGKCNISGEADAVLSEAASAAKSSGSASVRVVGHTDTMGSGNANQKLSECRADAAKSNLVDKGIPPGSISASGRGESDLAVQTGDNAGEPQNNRVVIDLR